MAVNNYIGNVGNPSGASLILNSIKKSMDEQKAQKLAMAQFLIQSGQYQPTALGQGPSPNLFQRIGQSFTGPQLGGQNMNIEGQNFQYQSPEVKMANLKTQLQAIQGLGQQPNQPGLGQVSGLPSSLPGVQVEPKIDFNSMTAEPNIKTTTPLEQAEYQSKLLDIQDKMQKQKESEESNQYSGMSSDDIRSQISKNNPTEAAILKKLANGDMTLKDIPYRNPSFVKKITGDLALAYPGFDEQKIAMRRKVKLDYSPAGQIGKQATTAGTIVQHMYELKNAIKDLHNSGVPIWNKAMQTAGRTFGPGSSALKKYETIKNAIAGEWDKYLRAGGSSEAGIDRILQTMDEAATPEAQNAVLDEGANLMAGRMGQYVDGWKSAFDQPGDPKIPSYVMSTRTRYALQKMGLDDVIKGVENPEGMAGTKSMGEGKYSVGQTITHGGKQYRVTGGDPNDPDIEEVK